MTDTIWQTIAATPWWIQLFLIYLFWISLASTKPRFIAKKTLSLLPFFFIFLSIMCMFAIMPTITWLHPAIWTGAFCLGSGLGYLQFWMMNIKAVEHSNLVYLPGSWLVFIILLLVITARAYFGFQISFEQSMLLDPHYSFLLILLYGLLAGLCLGRFAYARRCLKSGPFTHSHNIALT